jgi:hypothetical protein
MTPSLINCKPLVAYRIDILPTKLSAAWSRRIHRQHRITSSDPVTAGTISVGG